MPKSRTKIRIPIYNRTIHLFADIEEMERWAGRDYPDVDFYMQADGITWYHKESERQHGVWLGTCDHEAIYHEALHLAWNVLDSVGIEVTHGNHEMLTYLQSFIAAKIIEVLDCGD